MADEFLKFIPGVMATNDDDPVQFVYDFPPEVWIYGCGPHMDATDAASIRQCSTTLHNVFVKTGNEELTWTSPEKLSGNSSFWLRGARLADDLPRMPVADENVNSQPTSVVIGWPSARLRKPGLGDWDIRSLIGIVHSFTNLRSFTIRKVVFPLECLLTLLQQTTRLVNLCIDDVYSPPAEWCATTTPSLVTRKSDINMLPNLRTLTLRGKFKFNTAKRTLIVAVILLAIRSLQDIELDWLSLRSIAKLLSHNFNALGWDARTYTLCVPVHGTHRETVLLDLGPSLRNLTVNVKTSLSILYVAHPGVMAHGWLRHITRAFQTTITSLRIIGDLPRCHVFTEFALSSLDTYEGPLSFITEFLPKEHSLTALRITDPMASTYGLRIDLMTIAPLDKITEFSFSEASFEPTLCRAIASAFPRLQVLKIKLEVGPWNLLLETFAQPYLASMKELRVFWLYNEQYSFYTAQQIDEIVLKWAPSIPSVCQIRLDPKFALDRGSFAQEWFNNNGPF
ncbi:hypothetical protein PQX77_002799 [Marasmius sp. AFHP31]|nr:hypothetical protein PQX77_002799 [Marasmius sp. AFHP31]